MSAKRNITLELLKLFKLPVYVITAIAAIIPISLFLEGEDWTALVVAALFCAVGWFVIKVLDVFITELSKDDE